MSLRLPLVSIDVAIARILRPVASIFVRAAEISFSVGGGRIVGGQLVPIPLSEGDIVLFSKYGAEDVNLDGQDYLLLRYDEIKLKENLIVA